MASSQLKFIVDECTGPHVARWLESDGYHVLSIYDEMRGIKDVEVLKIAQSDRRIIITNDKDFGEMVFRQRLAHPGIVLLRLDNERSKNKIDVLKKLLVNHLDELTGNFLVVTEKSVRVIKQ